MFLKTPFNHNTNAESDRTGLECKDPSLAQQHFKDECDINVLFARYLETGEMPQVLDGLSYGNFEGVFDFQTAMNAVRTAEGVFQQLPARIKNRFDNDPQKLLAFMADENNRDEAVFLGLLNKPEPTNADRTSEIPPERTQTQPGHRGTETSAATPQQPEKPGPKAG